MWGLMGWLILATSQNKCKKNKKNLVSEAIYIAQCFGISQTLKNTSNISFVTSNTQLIRSRKMKNRICTLAFLAAALIIAPGAAYAQQGQAAEQNMNQNVVIGGSGNSVNTSGTQISNQHQKKTGWCNYGKQIQNSGQNLGQNAVVFGHGNRVNIDAVQRNVQRQASSGGCY
jgi:hypothetical protein